MKTSAGKRPVEDQEFLDNALIGSALISGSDAQLEEAYNEIGEYYAERQKYETAVKYFILGRNVEKQAECYYILEDYNNLNKIMDQLPENSEFLSVRLFL